MNFHRWHRQILGMAMSILSSPFSSSTSLLSTNNNFLIIVIPIIIHGAASAFSVPYSNIHQRSQRRLSSGGLLSNTPPPPTFRLHHTTTTATILSYQQRQHKQHRWYHQNTVLYQAKPLRGSAVESYRTVSVNCSKCRTQLFRYKKKNGTKSNLVKCYIERIADDTAGLLEGFNNEKSSSSSSSSSLEEYQWNCPSCGSNFARTRMIHGRPALKLVGGKIRMTK